MNVKYVKLGAEKLPNTAVNINNACESINLLSTNTVHINLPNINNQSYSFKFKLSHVVLTALLFWTTAASVHLSDSNTCLHREGNVHPSPTVKELQLPLSTNHRSVVIKKRDTKHKGLSSPALLYLLISVIGFLSNTNQFYYKIRYPNLKVFERSLHDYFAELYIFLNFS